MICDEFGHNLDKSNSGVFTNALLPMMIVEGRAMICVTTPPEGAAGGYHELFKVRDDYNNPVFKVYEIRTVCPECHEKGVRSRCKHFTNRVPTHHSEEQMNKIRKIMEAVGRAATFERETTGIASSVDDKCFPSPVVDTSFATAYEANPHHEYETVFISVDPNSGPIRQIDPATSSDFAICTTYRNFRGDTVLFGLTGFPCTESDRYVPHLQEHVRRIRATPYLQRARIVVIVECKTGREDEKIVNTFLGTGDLSLVIMNEAELKIGIPTNHRIKREMMVETLDQLKRGRFAWDTRMFSTTPGLPPATAALADRTKLRLQLLAYKEVVRPQRDPLEPPSVHYSGKPHKDDFAVALQLNCLYARKFREDPRYDRYRRA